MYSLSKNRFCRNQCDLIIPRLEGEVYCHKFRIAFCCHCFKMSSCFDNLVEDIPAEWFTVLHHPAASGYGFGDDRIVHREDVVRCIGVVLNEGKEEHDVKKLFRYKGGTADGYDCLQLSKHTLVRIWEHMDGVSEGKELASINATMIVTLALKILAWYNSNLYRLTRYDFADMNRVALSMLKHGDEFSEHEILR